MSVDGVKTFLDVKFQKLARSAQGLGQGIFVGMWVDLLRSNLCWPSDHPGASSY